MFQTDSVKTIKTHVLFSINCFRISCRLGSDVEKYDRVTDVTDDSVIMRMPLHAE
jgi:hypothetical protein